MKKKKKKKKKKKVNREKERESMYSDYRDIVSQIKNKQPKTATATVMTFCVLYCTHHAVSLGDKN